VSLRPLLHEIAEEPALIATLGSRDAHLAVPEPALAPVLAAAGEAGERRPLVIVVPTTTAAERLHRDLESWLGADDVALFPAWETLPFERVSPGVETMGRRLKVLWQLGHPERCPSVVVAPVRAVIQRLGPGLDDIAPVVVGVGDQVDRDDLVERLAGAGYRRDVQIEHRGDFAVRGSIIDVFPSTADTPIRIDLWGDEVDRVTEFSMADQRATMALSEAQIYPCRELMPDDAVKARAEQLIGAEPWGREQWERLAEGAVFDGMESWLPWLTDSYECLFDHLGASAQVVLVHPGRLRKRAEELRAEEADLAAVLGTTWGIEANSSMPRLHLGFEDLLAGTDAPLWTVALLADSPSTPTVAATGWDQPSGDDRGPVGQLLNLVSEGYRVLLAADSPGSGARLAHILDEHGIAVTEATARDLQPGRAVMVVAPLTQGCVLPELKLAILSEPELTGRRRSHRPARKRRVASGPIDDLVSGSYVVHHQHGVARYGGMVTRSIGGSDRDYLLLEYRGGDRLYVPSDQIDAVRQYSGGDSPTLNRMGGSDWQRAKSKVRVAVQEVAQELVVLYQKRVTTLGHAFAADTPWQQEIEAAFPYRETPDQLEAITAVKADMEDSKPMDRLVCGDVGFGKTEIAIRAAFKAVQDGKQVAVLVPTTLLAQQHYQTFSERFAGYPIRVEVLSRFLTPGQARAVTNDLADGQVDLVIGTHRLLSADIKFRDLGLLVVDEEQRFGVTHKEAIKEFKAEVDVLTLTATPIPRTLEMSLTGIRDLTLLNTPPAERQPILTYVGEYDDRAVAEAIRRELLREGQVFYVHNRVMDIEHVAADLRQLVPEARVAVAHGQMDEGSLEQIVLDFWAGDYDVLVCTTIIESGIDMPTVNTLVVDRAEMLGLGQLHQIRGRVGRSGVRAYAYMLTPQDRVLTEEAYERLKTIGEATELGSGFKIAMRDLEIRGAGNLLGVGQSGHIAAVGYDLYCQLVTEAVAELKGEVQPEPAETKLEVPLDAYLPDDYVPKESMRLGAYRRLVSVSTHDEVTDIRAEWLDRYGPLPAPAEALLEVARLRAECARTGITEVSVQPGPGFGGPKHFARLAPVTLKTSKQMRLERVYPKAVYKEELMELQLPIKMKLNVVDEVVAALSELLPEA
jgi:transcription-repair coupling factor (superfamily II helicase)